MKGGGATLEALRGGCRISVKMNLACVLVRYSNHIRDKGCQVTGMLPTNYFLEANFNIRTPYTYIYYTYV